MTANRSHPEVDYDPRATVLARLYGDLLAGVLTAADGSGARAATDYIPPPFGRA